jgi:hypothetical protein
LQNDDILISSRGTIFKVAIFQKQDNYKTIPSGFLSCIRLNPYLNTSVNYVVAYLRHKESSIISASNSVKKSSAINTTSKNYIAVKYDKSDDLVAGEDSFDKFFQGFQNKLDTIGKRQDILIFNKKDFDSSLGYDISQIEHNQIKNYVKKAVSAIEVRSSTSLIDKYDLAMCNRIEKFTKQALSIKKRYS